MATMERKSMDYNHMRSSAVNLQTLRSPSRNGECRRYNIVPDPNFFWTHLNNFFVTLVFAAQRRLQILPRMLLMLLWWMSNLANNWSQAFTAGATRLTAGSRAQCPSSHLPPSCTLLLTAGSRAQCPSSYLPPSCTLLLIAGIRKSTVSRLPLT